MAEQLALFDVPTEPKKTTIDEKKKRNWEDGFQRRSNNQFDKTHTISRLAVADGAVCVIIVKIILMADLACVR